MAEDIVTIVNDIGNKEGIPDGIHFHNIHNKSTLSDLYANKVVTMAIFMRSTTT